MTLLDEDTEVHIDELTEDAPPICNLPDCEKEAAWLLICPNGHFVRLKSNNRPACVCDEHGKHYPAFLLELASKGKFVLCADCNAAMDGRLLPLP